MPLNKFRFFDKPLILAVDDEPMNRFIIEDMIENRYQLTMLESGELCLDFVKDTIPDLILLDINMPGISGYEVCKALKENPATHHIPVIFLTAMMKVDDEKKGLQMGAVDFITKPFTEAILLARINTQLELSFTRKILEHHNQVLKKERSYIEQILESMHADKRFDSNNLDVMSLPIEKSSGDIVLSATNQDNHQQILMGDFTGHGLHAAIAGPLASSLFYALVEENHSAEFILKVINNELFCKLPTNQFLAAVYIDWDKTQNQVTIWNFGLPDAIFYDQQTFTLIPSISLALGIVEFSQHNVQPARFDITMGDKLFVYTDGISEAINTQKQYFGAENVLKVIDEIAKQSLSIDIMLNRLEMFSEGQPLKDDATMLELSFNA
ncbi:fused response regulator/phosphatase [Thiomicrorhabdus sp. Milos-T2]|uniref:fused response regulator/phosphatase n=1 Tax=Thiomicrorhabdus sp. Milos-T2 TaxID=90814 RepID=UPI0004943C2D|nr:fused response regulator/phosphatase [Thiomicrorhabdus sp. Milos-T2]